HGATGQHESCGTGTARDPRRRQPPGARTGGSAGPAAVRAPGTWRRPHRRWADLARKLYGRLRAIAADLEPPAAVPCPFGLRARLFRQRAGALGHSPTGAVAPRPAHADPAPVCAGRTRQRRDERGGRCPAAGRTALARGLASARTGAGMHRPGVEPTLSRRRTPARTARRSTVRRTVAAYRLTAASVAGLGPRDGPGAGFPAADASAAAPVLPAGSGRCRTGRGDRSATAGGRRPRRGPAYRALGSSSDTSQLGPVCTETGQRSTLGRAGKLVATGTGGKVTGRQRCRRAPFFSSSAVSAVSGPSTPRRSSGICATASSLPNT